MIYMCAYICIYIYIYIYLFIHSDTTNHKHTNHNDNTTTTTNNHSNDNNNNINNTNSSNNTNNHHEKQSATTFPADLCPATRKHGWSKHGSSIIPSTHSIPQDLYSQFLNLMNYARTTFTPTMFFSMSPVCFSSHRM